MNTIVFVMPIALVEAIVMHSFKRIHVGFLQRVLVDSTVVNFINVPIVNISVFMLVEGIVAVLHAVIIDTL